MSTTELAESESESILLPDTEDVKVELQVDENGDVIAELVDLAEDKMHEVCVQEITTEQHDDGNFHNDINDNVNNDNNDVDIVDVSYELEHQSETVVTIGKKKLLVVEEDIDIEESVHDVAITKKLPSKKKQITTRKHKSSKATTQFKPYSTCRAKYQTDYKDSLLPITQVNDPRIDYFNYPAQCTEHNSNIIANKKQHVMNKRQTKRKVQVLERQKFETRYRARLNRRADSFFLPLQDKWLAVYDKNLKDDKWSFDKVMERLDDLGSVKILIKILLKRGIFFKGLVGAQRHSKNNKLSLGQRRVYVGGEHIFGRRKCSPWGPIIQDKVIQ